jgi:hypothetical protein
LNSDRDVRKDLTLGEGDARLGSLLLKAEAFQIRALVERHLEEAVRAVGRDGLRHEELERVLVDVVFRNATTYAEEEAERDLGLAKVLGSRVDGLHRLEGRLPDALEVPLVDLAAGEALLIQVELVLRGLLDVLGELERRSSLNHLKVRGLDLQHERALRVDTVHLRRGQRRASHLDAKVALAREAIFDGGVVRQANRVLVRRTVAWQWRRCGSAGAAARRIVQDSAVAGVELRIGDVRSGSLGALGAHDARLGDQDAEAARPKYLKRIFELHQLRHILGRRQGGAAFGLLGRARVVFRQRRMRRRGGAQGRLLGHDRGRGGVRGGRRRRRGLGIGR